ncbi:MAG: response regulator [bacterium]|nr:response regulator [bacterium]
MRSDTRLRILLVDDSQIVRVVLNRILRKAPDIQVVGEAEDGLSAVHLAARLRPDVILMDIAMPRLDGIEATEQIMAEAPTAILVFSSEARVAEGRLVFEALERGAVDVLAKPESPAAWTQLATQLPEQLRVVARSFSQDERHKTGRVEPPPAIPAAPSELRAPIRFLAIGASTGGPEALREFLAEMAPEPPMAILVVQHIAREFEEGLVEWLRRDLQLDFRIATEGEYPQPGAVRLGPQGSHLRLEAGGWLRLDTETAPLRGHRPAADALLRSCAVAAGHQAAGILLSGMGRDGVEGLLALRDAGCVTLVQNRATSVVFGMPQAALEARAASVALSPRGLARYLLDLSTGSVP